MNVIGELFPDGFWAEARRRLAQAAGRPAWRALEELLEDPSFEQAARQEFPWLGRPEPGLSRRDFLKLMGASLAMAGLTACAPAKEKLFSYQEMPEDLLPGKPLFYATAHVHGGLARGALLESHYGRPTKVEGNPDHPDSLGGTDAPMQASVLELWDPERSQAPLRGGLIASWAQFLSEAGDALSSAGSGSRVRVLTGAVSSPTLLEQLSRFKRAFPDSRHCVFEPAAQDNGPAGTRLALGRPLWPRYALERADVVVALDCDLLLTEPGGLRHARRFAARRQPESGRMLRLYAAEPTPSATGSMADHRLALAPSQIPALAAAVAAECGVDLAPAPAAAPWKAFARAAARDLSRARGAALLAAGRRQPPEVHALCAVVNEALGADGRTVAYGPPPLAAGDLSLRELAAELSGGKVDVLLILESNPAYSAPGGLEFAEALARPTFSVHFGLFADETARRCLWHLPAAHAYESWSDARAVDGTATIMQPLIAPLYDGRSASELLAALLGSEAAQSHDLVKTLWTRGRSAPEAERFWEKSVHDGVAAGTAFPAVAARARTEAVRRALRPPPPAAGMEYGVEPSPRVWDGRYANNVWLQELPDPATRQTWGEAVLLSPEDADRLGARAGDVLELSLGGRRLEAPALPLPGQARGCATLRLGAGRSAGGDIAAGVGPNAAALLPASGEAFLPGLSLRKTGRSEPLALTQLHHVMEGPPQVRAATLAQFLQKPGFAQPVSKGDVSLFGPQAPGDYAWGMSINLNSCIGCGACVAACQAENNIPTVGKEQVLAGREMHWIRIDRYYQGGPDEPAIYSQPVPCMQCEHAPCELVCPVGATLHDAQGLNQMIYNRCVGTRYCSNNCPYKVRRFNFFGFADHLSDTEKLQRNPDVSVRSRGVMEKCTYCVQRINAVRFAAQNDDRRVRDGEIVPACAQACPARAIVFGDIQNKANEVARLKALPRDYSLLDELGTRPRTTYLARVTNPNPELEGGAG